MVIYKKNNIGKNLSVEVYEIYILSLDKAYIPFIYVWH